MGDSHRVAEDSALQIAANDALLERIGAQVALDTFDGSDRQTLQQLVEGLGDPRGLIRLRFAETLGQIGAPATPLLREALANHPNAVVRRAAAKTLTIIGDASAVPTLLHSFLNDEDTVVRSSAAGALAKTGEVAVPALLDILSDPEQPEDIKGHAAWALAFIGPEAAAQLYKALDSDCLDVRRAAIGAIARIAQERSDDRSCSALVCALSDPEPTIRAEAASTFGQVNYPPAIPHLISAIQDPEIEVRKAAVSSLGKLGNPSDIEPLRAALQDPETVVQVLAKLAIAQIQNRAEERP
ncbi:HEAT repeat domain-containing protein [Altericista sp. CCNU0014]|uniref:HEAT repeat domain-containing protein n=1 Tax=Altericista sp. CCNU0014 TaxID=3082949 RepID=UPI00384BDD1B